MRFYLLVILAIAAFFFAVFMLFHTLTRLVMGVNPSYAYVLGRGLLVAIGLALAHFAWTQASLTIGS